MIQRMLASGLIAGCAAGLLAALLHFAFAQNLLLLAEKYESGALVHFQGVQGVVAAPSHDAGAGAEPAPAGQAEAGAMPSHDQPAAADGESQVRRNALTVLFMALTYMSYGVVLVAGMALATHFGIAVSAGEGLLWGIAGFAVFQLAPAMGLQPNLPGTVAAYVGDRQVWWWGTALATGTGLALLAWGRGLPMAVIAGALIAAPHAIGAPEVEGFSGTAPPEVAAAFAARVLGNALVTWAVLGWLAARLWNGKTA
jgi:cobalt transporter subunit CbtA